jgi:linoleoyl-CoA desaturase
MSKFTYNQESHPFFDKLQQKVYAYFEDNKIEMTGGPRIWLKALIYIALAILNYWLMLWVVPIGWWSVLLCITMGGMLAAIGFNVMHDGAHGAFSKHEWVNNIMGFSLNFMGGDVNLWKIKHNLIHHSFTNVEGLDDDIDVEPYLRTNPYQEYKKMHRFQHLYVTFFYALTYLNWIFFADFEKYFTRKVGDVTFKKLSTKAHISFWFGKVGFIFLALVLPMIVVGVWKTLVGFIIATFACGILLALVFQVAHVVKETSFLSADEKRTDMEWAVTQLHGTANFSTKNPIMLFLTGGLNHQIEHHLFPRISHIHYPQISKIVKETCDEFGVQYHEYKSFLSAVASHYGHLRKMGVA